MKKMHLFLLAIVIAVAVSVLTFPCLMVGAEEIEPSIAPSVPVSAVVEPSTALPVEEPTTEEVKPTTTTDKDEEVTEATIVSRFSEWVNKHWAESVAGVTAALTVLFYSVALPWLRLKLKKVAKNEDLGVLVDAVNSLIDTINKIEEAHKQKNDEQDKATAEVKAELDEVKRECGDLCKISEAILKIEQIAYANNKNVPQGVKDIINLRYAKAMKATSESSAVAEGVTSNDQQNQI